MTKYLVIALLCFGFLTATAQTKKDTLAILAVLEAQRNGWNTGDMEMYMQGYWNSDSLLFVGKSGATYGWQKTLANYNRSYPNKQAMGFLTFSVKKVSFLNKKHAFVMGGWHLKREKDEPNGYFTLIFKKIDGFWKVIADHSS